MKNKSFNHGVLLLLLSILVALPIKGQTLHAIIFADTRDPQIGQGTLQDYYRFSVELTTIASATNMQLKTYYNKDRECSPENLKKVLSAVKTNKEDVILFYYSGHGGRSDRDVSEFPQMCLGSHIERDYYPLEKVLYEFDEQPARLKVVIADCCNSVGAFISPKNYESKNVTVISKGPVDVYNSLFSNNKGYVLVTSSKKGETSANLSFPDGKSGGAFTFCLLEVLKEIAARGMASTWTDIMDLTADATYKLAQHNPVYALDVKNMSATDTNTNATYQEPQNQASSEESEGVEPIVLLTAIGNEKYTLDSRVNAKDKMLAGLFASPKAKIEVVGSNGTTIVATETAEDFLLRLCTAHKLINLVEVDKTTDANGRYTYLRVHEIYKK